MPFIILNDRFPFIIFTIIYNPTEIYLNIIYEPFLKLLPNYHIDIAFRSKFSSSNFRLGGLI